MIKRTAILCSLLVLAGCSKITVLRTQELRKVEQEVKGVRGQVNDLSKTVDDINVSQGGLTSKMKADLTVMLAELQTNIQRLHAEIDETQHHLAQLNTKIDRLEQRRIVVSPGSAASGSSTAAPGKGAASGSNSQAATEPSYKIVDGIDLENLYNQAREDYIRAKYDLAFQGFKTVYEKDEGGSYKENTLYWMAECMLKAEKNDKALEAYRRTVQEFPRGTKVCASRFKIGMIHNQAKDISKRNDEWKLLVLECPSSNEAQRAQVMMKE